MTFHTQSNIANDVQRTAKIDLFLVRYWAFVHLKV